jgi:hypothetical protein
MRDEETPPHSAPHLLHICSTSAPSFIPLLLPWMAAVEHDMGILCPLVISVVFRQRDLLPLGLRIRFHSVEVAFLKLHVVQVEVDGVHAA